MSKDLLLEIGTEEIPAGFFPRALIDLKKKLSDNLKKNRLDFDDIETYGTPRRMAVIIKGLVEQQSDLKEEVKGPKAEIAFDENGSPTKAGNGFARGQGVDAADLIIKETPKGRYVFAIKYEQGKETVLLLPEILKSSIKALSFPKMMRWGDERLRFARPIHWILALYGDRIIEFELAGVQSSKKTAGHRFLAPGMIEINHPDEYLKRLEEVFVIADYRKREEIIKEQIEQLAGGVNGVVDFSGDLLHEVNFLVEYPTALISGFKEEYLKLPKEVLITSMKKHQRYFPVQKSRGGELLPYFITVRNGDRKNIKNVEKGNQWVLRARLEDAFFFYQEDQKTSLEEKNKFLEEIIFQKDLGTMSDKVKRIVELSSAIADHLGLGPDKKKLAERAARLAKSDLVTEMVGEFPNLQGIMGREYARIKGEEDEVCEAIFEHYLPRGADDIIPETETGIVVSLADKFDTLVGFFGLNLIPSGSQDPYALRRQAQGIIRILLEKRIHFSLHKIIDEALKIYLPRDFQLDENDIHKELEEFFAARLKKSGEEEGIRYDVMESIISSGFDDPYSAILRARALEELRGDREFISMVLGYKRAVNLSLKAEGETEVNPGLFQERVEGELWDKLIEVEEEIKKLEKIEDFPAIFRTFASLRPYIDNFLDGVMVMVKDEQVKNNRLALLKKISEIMGVYADLNQLVIEGD